MTSNGPTEIERAKAVVFEVNSRYLGEDNNSVVQAVFWDRNLQNARQLDQKYGTNRYEQWFKKNFPYPRLS